MTLCFVLKRDEYSQVATTVKLVVSGDLIIQGFRLRAGHHVQQDD